MGSQLRPFVASWTHGVVSGGVDGACTGQESKSRMMIGKRIYIPMHYRQNGETVDPRVGEFELGRMALDLPSIPSSFELPEAECS